MRWPFISKREGVQVWLTYIRGNVPLLTFKDTATPQDVEFVKGWMRQSASISRGEGWGPAVDNSH